MKTNGFTLLEIMVAISILVLVLVTVFKMHIQTLAMHNTARFQTSAPLLAQKKITEIETKNIDELVSDSGDFGDRFPGYTWKVSIDDVQSEILGTVADNLKLIGVTVLFNTDELIYHLESYKLFEE
ncbi:MAG: type II secretion system protein [Deltaproteobacteria bacterium]|nr:type II secretion system protein [Deltaproteobacteria bacterium]MBW2199409.1 type II secretion system protein [Deltaproteobacteria bacterium]